MSDYKGDMTVGDLIDMLECLLEAEEDKDKYIQLSVCTQTHTMVNEKHVVTSVGGNGRMKDHVSLVLQIEGK